MNDGNTSQTTPPPSGDKFFIASVLLGGLIVGSLFAWATLTKRQQERTAAAQQQIRFAQESLFSTSFTMTERSGATVSSSELKGRFLVLNLVWTSCSLTCLQVNQQMEKIQALTADQNDVQLISLSVDPDEDTPAALTQFANRFHADTHRWLFLTGSKSNTTLLAEGIFGRDEFANLAHESAQAGASESKSPNLLMNTGLIALLDTEGRVRGNFNGLKGTTPEAVLKALTNLRRENSRGNSPKQP